MIRVGRPSLRFDKFLSIAGLDILGIVNEEQTSLYDFFYANLGGFFFQDIQKFSKAYFWIIN
jgi:hypothetical protein